MDFYITPLNKKCVIDDCEIRAGYGYYKDGWFLRKDTCEKHKSSGMVRITNTMIQKERMERQRREERLQKKKRNANANAVFFEIEKELAIFEIRNLFDLKH